ncbi:MAG: Zn-ribbon containing protein [Nanoarchaeota archaeon]|nr:Zn-ribbon containing protein [Nanoarchaeota archaeon]
MPHQCVRCSKMYEDGSKEILTGCSCGGKFFFFMKEKSIQEANKFTQRLSEEDKVRIEKDAMDLIGDRTEDEMSKDYPVVLDLESIRVLKPGKFEIDLVDLFRGEPLVYKLSDGKYVIDIASTFESADKK